MAFRRTALNAPDRVTAVTPKLRRQRQEDYRLEVNLGYTVRLTIKMGNGKMAQGVKVLPVEAW